MESVKRVVSEESEQADIYQVCEYVRKRNIHDVYILYPMYRYEATEPDYLIGKSKNIKGIFE